MKKATLLLGLALSLLLTSCNSDIDNFNENQSENTKEKANTLINQQQAKTAALNFIKNNKKAKGIPEITERNLEDIQAVINENDEPIIYVLNTKENNGFIVMSGSTLERPILAYSNEGNFDLATIEEHKGVDDWLFTKYLKIEGLKQKGKPLDENIGNQWKALGVQTGVGLIDNNGNFIPWQPFQLISETKQTHGPLLGNIEWNQRYSDNTNDTIFMYNNNVRYNNCPQGIAPVGCGAVAMGQIMKYHNHPNMFNISTMYPYIRTSGTYAYNTQPALNIASFLEHISTRVNSYFYCDRSGGASQNTAAAFSTYYNYTTSSLVAMDLNIIKTDILNNKPVLLRGKGCRGCNYKTA